MATAAQLRTWAKAQVGKRYVWGGNGPNVYDCSGFVLAAWRQCGLDVKDTTAAYIYRMTTKVAGTAYRAGDVVTLRNSSAAFNGIGHIAMLTHKLANGDWEIVEAKGKDYGLISTLLSVWKHRPGYQPPRRHPKLRLTPSLPAPPPKPVTPLDFRLVAWNILGRRYDTTKTWPTRKPRVINRLRHVLADTSTDTASLLVLTECGAAEAKELAQALNMRWATYLYTTVLYSKAWKLTGTWKVTNQAGTHGTLICELTRAGRTLNLAASHFPPGVAKWPLRKRLAAAIHTRAKGWTDPTIHAGDLNSSTRVEKQMIGLGWMSARRAAITTAGAAYKTATDLKAAKLAKGSPLDYVLGRKVIMRGYRLLRGIDPTTGKPASDHHMITTQLTIR